MLVLTLAGRNATDLTGEIIDANVDEDIWRAAGDLALVKPVGEILRWNGDDLACLEISSHVADIVIGVTTINKRVRCESGDTVIFKGSFTYGGSDDDRFV